MDKWLCVDVDGVLADNSDLSIPYYDRPAYPDAVVRMRKLHEAGFKLRILTARGMEQFDGDLKRIWCYHYSQLKWWLEEHNIHFDEICFGKPPATYYIDDNAWRVRSGDSDSGWESLFVHLGVSE